MASSGSGLSTLDQLKQYSNVIADTPQLNRFAPYSPTDITTNPTNILAASKDQRCLSIVNEAIAHASAKTSDVEVQVEEAYRRLLVGFGAHVHAHISGFVSTQIDPGLAFNTQGTISEACRLIDMYGSLGVPKQRIMIKIPATWEGLQAAHILEQAESHDIRCTMTLVQSVTQAVLAAELGVTMVSPFVGRVLDWWHRYAPGKDYSGPKDPGVKLCREIEDVFRKRGYNTKILAAVRSVDECVHLAGIDAMTLNPGLLEELRSSHYRVDRIFGLEPKLNSFATTPQDTYLHNEAKFRIDFFNDQVGYEKAAEGLRVFMGDIIALKKFLRELLLVPFKGQFSEQSE